MPPDDASPVPVFGPWIPEPTPPPGVVAVAAGGTGVAVDGTLVAGTAVLDAAAVALLVGVAERTCAGDVGVQIATCAWNPTNVTPSDGWLIVIGPGVSVTVTHVIPANAVPAWRAENPSNAIAATSAAVPTSVNLLTNGCPP